LSNASIHIHEHFVVGVKYAHGSADNNVSPVEKRRGGRVFQMKVNQHLFTILGFYQCSWSNEVAPVANDFTDEDPVTTWTVPVASFSPVIVVFIETIVVG
jgi:hypothetical protein